MLREKKLILCVDGHEDTGSMLKAFLEIAGHEVLVAASIAEALNLAHQQRFDLYIIEYKFSDGNGLELCRQLRAFDAATPIIFCTTSAREADSKLAIAAGAQAYIVKPNALDALEMAVSNLLKN